MSSSAHTAYTLRVRTRAQKRRMGERDLWDVIVHNDDICFKLILPRLNRTDIKFLYEVNTETRKLIKRSSRKEELKKRFKVREMSSVSTLEFAWENKSLWPRWWTETYFCWRVASTNKLELLKWAREEKKCEWGEGPILTAAQKGNLEMVNEEVEEPWDSLTAEWAAESGHLHILEYLVERKYDQFDRSACMCAATNGHLDCLKYLHETAKAPWDDDAVQEAHENNHPECVQYLLDNNCPLPPGWRYENGELHVSE
ncbi:unnamed protein product [Bathycoccus prasinos]